MSHPRSSGSGIKATFVAAVLALTLAACVDDDTDDATPGPSDTTTTEDAVDDAPTTTTTTEPDGVFDRTLEVVIEEHPEGLSGYRLTRPVDLGAMDEPLPVVVWGNGACRRTPPR